MDTFMCYNAKYGRNHVDERAGGMKNVGAERMWVEMMYSKYSSMKSSKIIK